VVVVVVFLLLAVQDAVGGAVEAVTEGVVLAVLVVISHINAVLTLAGWVDRALLGDLDFFVKGNGLTLGVTLLGVLARVGALILPPTGVSVLFGKGGGTLAVVSLSYVDTGVVIDLGCRSVTGLELAVVDSVFDVDLGVGVSLEGRLVSAVRRWTLAIVMPKILMEMTGEL